MCGDTAGDQKGETMNSDLSNVQVGDYIWTIKGGWCEVVAVRRNASYPIICSDSCVYTLDGKLFADSAHPSAFIEPPDCFNPEPKPCRFKKGDKVLVRDSDYEKWYRRYFSHVNNTNDDRRFVTFWDGKDEWSSEGKVCCWKYCKPWKEGGDE